MTFTRATRERGHIMIRALRALLLAVVIATSLLASGSVASANDNAGNKAPTPQPFGITWE